jgi:kumamolisin
MPVAPKPSPNTHVPLPGSRRYHRAGAEVLGRADPHEWCVVTLKLRRAKELPAPDTTTGAPVLSLQELTDTYGATANDLGTVEQALRPYGITVVSKHPETCRIKLAGPVEAMERAFQTHLFRARHNGHGFRARTGDLQVPAELRGIVTGVFGLDTRPMVQSRRTGGSASAAALGTPQTRPWFLPQELADHYEFPANDGAGQTIALLEFGGSYVATDLEAFTKLSGLAMPEVVTVEVEPLTPTEQHDADSTAEVMLDIEVLAGACPGAKIVVYFSNFTEQGWVDAIDAVVHDAVHRPAAVSISWGLAEGEQVWTHQAIDAVNQSLQAAALLGIPVCVASGDDGSDCQVGDGRAHVSFPASSVYVLCVGGTMMPRHRGRITEVAWKEGSGLRKDHGGASGGGVSEMVPRPAWQPARRSVNPGAPDGRVMPDVAANAAASTGYFMVTGGKGQISGGTSAATPLWAALIARTNVARAAAGKERVGYLTPLLYQPNPRTGGDPLGKAACKDITVGDNIAAAAGGYTCVAGHDAVTGWGSPQGGKLTELLP